MRNKGGQINLFLQFPSSQYTKEQVIGYCKARMQEHENGMALYNYREPIGETVGLHQARIIWPRPNTTLPSDSTNPYDYEVIIDER